MSMDLAAHQINITEEVKEHFFR